MPKPKMSIARQLLVLQLLIISGVLVLFTAASYSQAEVTFRNTEGRKLLSVAESIASSQIVRYGVTSVEPHPVLAPVAENFRAVSGATSVNIMDTSGLVLTATDPTEIGQVLQLDENQSRRAWVGITEYTGKKLLAAHVPVIDSTQAHIGVVAVGHDYPTWGESLARSAPNLLTYVGVASFVGITASLMLSRRLKRQTLGLEPSEIVELAQQREAMLHGIREGVLALDRDNRVTLLNDEARHLLGLPESSVGKSLSELAVEGELRDILTGKLQGEDLLVMWKSKILVINRMPTSNEGKDHGSITTLRDRTELLSLQHELDVTRNTTSALRAQTHEFLNRLHVISGLIQLDRTDEVVNYITSVSKDQTIKGEQVAARIRTPAVAALLMAKTSLAAERDIELKLSEESYLGKIDDELEVDLVTVIGNLVDNALEALRSKQSGWVDVLVKEVQNDIHVVVSDSGRGVPPELLEEIFNRGFTTKATQAEEHGIGLALVRMVCQRRGGTIKAINNEDSDVGTIFSAVLPSTERNHDA